MIFLHLSSIRYIKEFYFFFQILLSQPKQSPFPSVFSSWETDSAKICPPVHNRKTDTGRKGHDIISSCTCLFSSWHTYISWARKPVLSSYINQSNPGLFFNPSLFCFFILLSPSPMLSSSNPINCLQKSIQGKMCPMWQGLALATAKATSGGLAVCSPLCPAVGDYGMLFYGLGWFEGSLSPVIVIRGYTSVVCPSQ